MCLFGGSGRTVSGEGDHLEAGVVTADEVVKRGVEGLVLRVHPLAILDLSDRGVECEKDGRFFRSTVVS